jgi:hypothetical protein
MLPQNRWQRLLRTRVTDNLVRLQRRVGYDHSAWFGLELRKGSDWHSLTHDFAVHLLAGERRWRRLLRLAHAPSEFLVQTAVWNSPFRARLHDPGDEFAGSARLIDWERGEPYVFRVDDIDELVSSDRMFARKFVTDVDAEVVHRLAEHVRREARRATTRPSHATSPPDATEAP